MLGLFTVNEVSMRDNVVKVGNVEQAPLLLL
jgi:hypothetical protein